MQNCIWSQGERLGSVDSSGETWSRGEKIGLVDGAGGVSHNGYFMTLKEIVHFYNTRDVPGTLKKGMSWDPPEYPFTVNFDELGNLGLTDRDEDALAEFMKTLSDGYLP